MCSLFQADGEPLSLVSPEMAPEDCLQQTKSSSFLCVLLSVSLELTDDVDFCLPLTEKLLVCLLNQRIVLSEVSSWDDCDIGSGVHSKVNPLAVDQDVCVPRILVY